MKANICALNFVFIGSWLMLGVLVSFGVYLPFVEWLFFTTKPTELMPDSNMIIFFVTFALSFVSIPLSLGLAELQQPAKRFSRLFILQGIWLATLVAVSVPIRIGFYIAHRKLQSYPVGFMIPALVMPLLVSAGVVFFWGFRKVAPNKLEN